METVGAGVREIRIGAKRAVWLCHTSDSQQRSAPEAGESKVQVISERALSRFRRDSQSTGLRQKKPVQKFARECVTLFMLVIFRTQARICTPTRVAGWRVACSA